MRKRRTQDIFEEMAQARAVLPLEGRLKPKALILYNNNYSTITDHLFAAIDKCGYLHQSDRVERNHVH